MYNFIPIFVMWLYLANMFNGVSTARCTALNHVYRCRRSAWRAMWH